MSARTDPAVYPKQNVTELPCDYTRLRTADDMSSSSLTPPTTTDLGDLYTMISESLASAGPWATYARLLDLRKTSPDDLKLRGYCEMIRNVIVRDFLARPKGMQAVPRLTAEFLNNFDRFNLSAQEGYLVSLIDGRLDLQKLLVLSPFDPFTALFNLASLEQQKAITFPT